MKRLTALFLAGLFLFNLAGYRLFFHYVQENADSRYEQLLDKVNLDESQMITLKVDLDMPYLAENTKFERIDGEITIDGKIYKYVKRKIHNGQLVLLCLPYEQKTKLRSSREEYFSLANNLAAHSDSKQSAPKSSFSENITTDYDSDILAYNISAISEIINYQFPSDESFHSSVYYNLPAQPPDLV